MNYRVRVIPNEDNEKGRMALRSCLQSFFADKAAAAKWFEAMRKTYPDHTVVLDEGVPKPIRVEGRTTEPSMEEEQKNAEP